MKWLILLILVACGKHDEPGSIDLRDSDGDQVLNHQESELDKYIADFETLKKVTGSLKVNLGSVHEFSFSNQLDLEKNTLLLMAANENWAEGKAYFQEGSRLKFDPVKTFPLIGKGQYQIYLQFEEGSDKANEVLLINSTESISLGKWAPSMRIILSGENLSAILGGQAYLGLRKFHKKSALFKNDKDETIRNKTYRVQFFNGTKTRILYVSKELSFPELLKLLDIRAYTGISQDDLFFNTHLEEGNQWLTKEMANGDKIIAYTSLTAIREKLPEVFHYQKKIFKRSNGVASESFKLNNPEGAKVFLKITDIHFTGRTFVEKKQERRHGHGGGGGREGNGGSYYHCTHFLRSIKNESMYPATLETFFQNINQQETLLESEVLEQIENSGVFWEIKLNNATPHLEWNYSNRPSSTFITTGEYHNSCAGEANRGRDAAHRTNEEGKFSVMIESYVEKIAL